MKKYVLLLILLTITKLGNSQDKLYGLPYDNNSEKITYESIIKVENIDQETLFKKGKEWLMTKYILKGNPLIMEDVSESIIIVTGYAPIQYRSRFLIFWNTKEFNLLYTIKFSSKDNKYKLELTNFIIQEPVSGKSFGTVNWGGYANVGAVYARTKAPEIRNYPVENFFEKKYRRKKFGLAFNQFQEIVQSVIDESKPAIINSMDEDNW